MRSSKIFSQASLRRAIPILGLIAAAAYGQTSSTDLSITMGKTMAVDYPTDVGRISTSNPDVVDAVAVSTRELLLHAKGLGISTVIVWAKTGERSFYNVTVEQNLEPVRRMLRDAFPDEAIEVRSARDSVSLIGKVSSQSISDRAAAMVATLSKAVVNNLQAAPAPSDKQILLRVKFAEVTRTAGLQLGVNLMSTGALNTPGAVSTGQFSPSRPTINGTTTNLTITDALNVFMFRPDLNLASTIRALQSEGVLQILAEPNLLATNGKEASFLAGGEFPVPILQGGSNGGAVTVSFREYGIRLTFLPTLTANNTLKMHVKPEVSTIDLGNAVTVSGFTIPALGTRRIETDVELAPGQSFVIGGLMDDRVQDTMSKIPGISSIPVIGALFKTKESRKNKTELIVMVTPELVNPLNAIDPKPAPVMPKDFLPPTKPNAKAAPARGTAGKAQASRKVPEPEVRTLTAVLPQASDEKPVIAQPESSPAVAESAVALATQPPAAAAPVIDIKPADPLPAVH